MVRSQGMADVTIAGLAREGGVGVETVRYYQRRGLLETPERPEGSGSNGGIRRYTADDVRRLRFIRSAQAAGFTLEQIGELVALDATAADRREDVLHLHFSLGKALEDFDGDQGKIEIVVGRL